MFADQRERIIIKIRPSNFLSVDSLLVFNSSVAISIPFRVYAAALVVEVNIIIVLTVTISMK